MSSSAPLVLFIGATWYGSNAASYAKAFVRIGTECVTVSSDPLTPSHPTSVGRAARRLRGGRPSERAIAHWNRNVLATALAVQPDVIFVAKGIWLHARTIEALPACVKVHYHPDDVLNPHEMTASFIDAVPLWDLHVTNRRHNVTDLKGWGARDVLRISFAYDRDWHRPVAAQGTHRFPVAFIGTRRADRRALVNRLASTYRKDFVVSGPKWGRSVQLRQRATVLPPQYGIQMSELVARSKVCLGLLNSANRDGHTSRTFEIPAAGGVLLAERTDEHMELFEDRHEAVLYSTWEELEESLAELLSAEDVRGRVAAAGHRRVVDNPNTYEDRAIQVLGHVGVDIGRCADSSA